MVVEPVCPIMLNCLLMVSQLIVYIIAKKPSFILELSKVFFFSFYSKILAAYIIYTKTAKLKRFSPVLNGQYENCEIQGGSLEIRTETKYRYS